MSLIKLVYEKTDAGNIKVVVSVGERGGDGKHPSYKMEGAGVLLLAPAGWDALHDSLSRGVKKPHILLIEQGAE